MMCLFFVHQLSHPHLRTCALGTFSSKDLCSSTSYINSSCSNTLGREYDPKITIRSVSWKVMAMGQRMLDRRVLKIGSKRSKKGPAVARDHFWRRRQHSPAFCLTSHSHPTYRKAGGRRLGSTIFCPGCWLPLNYFDENVFIWCSKSCQNKQHYGEFYLTATFLILQEEV